MTDGDPGPSRIENYQARRDGEAYGEVQPDEAKDGMTNFVNNMILSETPSFGDMGQDTVEAYILDNEYQKAGDEPSPELQKKLEKFIASYYPLKENPTLHKAISDNQKIWDLRVQNKKLISYLDELIAVYTKKLEGNMLGEITPAFQTKAENDQEEITFLIPQIIHDSNFSHSDFDRWKA